uniref:Uncharacterized protein n=1 Tax=Trichobilharzia regenti TaxID=157069 RepID=A0AA85IZ15_TRIRE|nr:unnamed protein product [Trichobilharzia regenti]
MTAGTLRYFVCVFAVILSASLWTEYANAAGLFGRGSNTTTTTTKMMTNMKPASGGVKQTAYYTVISCALIASIACSYSF